MDMSDLREVERQLLSEVSGKLEEVGWELTAAQPTLLVKSISPDIEFQVRLNSDIKASIDRIRILPALGVRRIGISQLMARFRDLAPSITPSVGLNLNELLPDRSDIFRWAFLPSRNREDVQRLILSDIETYGAPFLESVASIEGIISFLEGRPSAQGRDEVLAIAYGLSENFTAARDVLGVIALRVPGVGPLASDQMLAFVRRASAYFGIDVPEV